MFSVLSFQPRIVTDNRLWILCSSHRMTKEAGLREAFALPRAPHPEIIIEMKDDRKMFQVFFPQFKGKISIGWFCAFINLRQISGIHHSFRSLK